MNAPANVFRAVDARDKAMEGERSFEGLFIERDFRYGRIRYLSTDYGVGQMLSLYGEYMEGEVALFRQILRPGDHVLSAGGNIGVHLIPLSQIVGPEGRVVTFEPQEFIREKLLMPNLEMNGCANVAVWPDALGAAEGEAYFSELDYTMPNNFGGMELRESGPVRTRVVPIDMFEYQRLDMLMLDVEGFELPALFGAKETIKRCRPYLYIEIDRESEREKVLHFMKDELGYELLYHTPSVFNPSNFARNKDNGFGAMCSVMCLGIPA